MFVRTAGSGAFRLHPRQYLLKSAASRQGLLDAAPPVRTKGVNVAILYARHKRQSKQHRTRAAAAAVAAPVGPHSNSAASTTAVMLPKRIPTAELPQAESATAAADWQSYRELMRDLVSSEQQKLKVSGTHSHRSTQHKAKRASSARHFVQALASRTSDPSILLALSCGPENLKRLPKDVRSWRPFHVQQWLTHLCEMPYAKAGDVSGQDLCDTPDQVSCVVPFIARCSLSDICRSCSRVLVLQRTFTVRNSPYI